MTTCMKSCDNFSYMFLNLVGEVGEFASKVAKALRKKKAIVDYNYLIPTGTFDSMTDQEIHDLRAEAGDILWQLAGLCHVMDWNLQDIGDENLAKLASRKERGVIDSEGDNR